MDLMVPHIIVFFLLSPERRNKIAQPEEMKSMANNFDIADHEFITCRV